MKHRSYRYVPALLWALFIFWGSAQQRPPSVELGLLHADKIIHAGLFGMLTLLLLWADMGAKDWQRRFFFWPFVVMAYGATDEIHQMFVPQRSPEWGDFIADSAGAWLAALVFRFWTRRQEQMFVRSFKEHD